MPLEGTYLAWVDFAGTGMHEDEIKDRIQDIFIDAEIQLYKETRAEEAVDSYLADLAEKELDNENA